ncbi:hypothetical protein V6N13_061097 [Hibiscus sabdariffa]|uniref:Uncharacterized protein n=1 Tax=Hibiscus sabdariffa TaxID=183260 RepID=A0ABR2EGC0_9ROSI
MLTRFERNKWGYSFSHRSSSPSSSIQGILQGSSHLTYGRSNSDFNDHENQLPHDKPELSSNEIAFTPTFEKLEAETSFKENMSPLKKFITGLKLVSVTHFCGAKPMNQMPEFRSKMIILSATMRIVSFQSRHSSRILREYML